jgi:hypothetical protein
MPTRWLSWKRWSATSIPTMIRKPGHLPVRHHPARRPADARHRFLVEDKITIARMLDEFGVDYVEGGYPGANPTDTAFFEEKRTKTRPSPPSA